MKVQFSIVLALVLSLVGANALAAETKTDYARLLETELNKVDFFNPEHWSFTQTVVEDDNTTIAKYDATRSAKQRWSLVSRNGQAANYGQMLDFRKDKQKQESRHRDLLVEAIDEGQPVEGGLAEMVAWDSLSLIDSSEKRVIYRFQPVLSRFDDDEQVLLVGVVTIDKLSKQLLSMEIMNRDVEGAEVEFPLESFLLKADFSYVNGNILLKSRSTLVREPAGMFGGGEERDAVSYSDYKSLH